MSHFGLTLWAYEVTGRATPLALVGFFFATPMVVLGPLVGMLVDRTARMCMFSSFAPIINGANQAIWQSRVAPDVQGRVFTTRRLVAGLVMPVSQLLAGPLADQVLEPAMDEGGRLVSSFGGLVGRGVGAGKGLLFVVTGVLAALNTAAAHLVPAVRNVEDALPDHDDAVLQQAAVR